MWGKYLNVCTDVCTEKNFLAIFHGEAYTEENENGGYMPLEKAIK
jgi:hypothetical protein